ncbi:unnamed protein product [Trichogramma brassicae]|uniref:Reverse transcriptase domain-containing protein n=1 Tax=Trichogramma brassicae TaxID=86971 RepID=A0A6H5ILJ8_9HYME|nr:unnamed protein product [Trichogramma brassicae]
MQTSGGVHGGPGRPFGSPARISERRIDAIESVTTAAREAVGGARGSRKYCAVVTLDVRNAFNSARLNNILAALERIRTPEYLQKIIYSYFQARVLEYDTDDGPESCSILAGVPQGSVLGPILWNVMYDSILRLRLDDGVRIVGFADDIDVVTVAGTTYEVEDLLSRAIARVRDALWGLGLETADHKTEALLFSRKRRLETITIEVGDCFIASSPCIRYLGIQLDARLTFNDHLIAASEKASKVAGALSQIMPTIGGPRSSRRRLYANVIDSILLYGAPIWSCGPEYGPACVVRKQFIGEPVCASSVVARTSQMIQNHKATNSFETKTDFDDIDDNLLRTAMEEFEKQCTQSTAGNKTMNVDTEISKLTTTESLCKISIPLTTFDIIMKYLGERIPDKQVVADTEEEVDEYVTQKRPVLPTLNLSDIPTIDNDDSEDDQDSQDNDDSEDDQDSQDNDDSEEKNDDEEDEIANELADAKLKRKVILVFEICGALRSSEIYDMLINDVHDMGNQYFVSTNINQNNSPINFIIDDLYDQKRAALKARATTASRTTVAITTRLNRSRGELNSGCRSHGDNNFRAISTRSKSVTFVPECEDEMITEMILSCEHTKVTVVCKKTLLMTLLARPSQSNPMRILHFHVPKANYIFYKNFININLQLLIEPSYKVLIRFLNICQQDQLVRNVESDNLAESKDGRFHFDNDRTEMTFQTLILIAKMILQVTVSLQKLN